MAILRWVEYIKSVNPKVRYIWGKNNVMENMLLRARYERESNMVSKDEDIAL